MSMVPSKTSQFHRKSKFRGVNDDSVKLYPRFKPKLKYNSEFQFQI